MKKYLFFVFLFCILAFYFVVWNQKPISQSEYLGNGITKITLADDNIVLEEYTKSLKTTAFELTYYIQESRETPSKVHYFNLFNLRKYKKFVAIAQKMTGLSQDEINAGVQEAITLAHDHPRQILVETDKVIFGQWEINWRISQHLREPADVDDNLLRYFCLEGKIILEE
jgi:hypothetical protein